MHSVIKNQMSRRKCQFCGEILETERESMSGIEAGGTVYGNVSNAATQYWSTSGRHGFAAERKPETYLLADTERYAKRNAIGFRAHGIKQHI